MRKEIFIVCVMTVLIIGFDNFNFYGKILLILSIV